MTDHIKIVSMDAQPKANFLRATFDAQIGGFLFKRCAIIWAEGKLMAVLPRSVGDSTDGRAVTFTDSDLGREFSARALRAFEAMGGMEELDEPDGRQALAWLRSNPNVAIDPGT